MLSDRAIQLIAENKIATAIKAGEFDDLPGLGKPAAVFDEPYDPHWWIRRKLKQEDLRPIDLCAANGLRASNGSPDRSDNRMQQGSFAANKTPA